MSAVLILLSVLLVLGVYWRAVSRARGAVRAWARSFGYRVVSARFETALSHEYQAAGKSAEVVYRVLLASPSGEQRTAYFLMWNVLHGSLSVVVQWKR